MTNRKSERRGKCSMCEKKKTLINWHKRKWKCRECLGEIPPYLEEHMGGCSPLGDLAGVEGACPRDVGPNSEFSQMVDAALKKNGWNKTQQKMRKELWAGGDNAQEAKRRKWAKELIEQEEPA